jgi:hypothetical protein
MFFVTQPVCSPLQLFAAAAGELQHSASAGSAAVTQDVTATASVPVDWLTPSAAYEIPVCSAKRFAASVDPIVGPRLPRPPTRGRCHRTSKLKQR